MRRRLISLQRPFLLLITRAFRTTSSSALQVLSGVPPLDLSVERESMLANVLRLRNSFSLWNRTYSPSDYMHHYSSFICSPSEFDLPLRISHNSSNIPSTDFSIFTDGSRIDGGTGCGLCVYSQQTLQFSWKRSLGPVNSVFQSELLALRKAVRLAASFLPLSSSIFSDSASSLQSLLQLQSRNPLVREIQTVLQSIPVTDRPWMAWIPAHVGIVGNEMADRLAKEAAFLSHRSLSSLPAPPSFLKRASYNSLLSIWQGRWDSDVVGRRTYSFLPRVSFSLQTSTSYLTCVLKSAISSPASAGPAPQNSEEDRQFTQVQRKPKSKRKPLSDHVLIISSTDTTVSPSALQKQLATSFNPNKIGAPIQQIRPTKSKELLVRCGTKEHLDKLKNSLTTQEDLKDKVQFREPRVPQRSIILFGVPSEFTADDLIKAFGDFSSPKKQGAIHPRTPLQRADSKNNWIINLDRDYFEQLGATGRLYLGFSSCPLRAYVRINRCFNCQEFGHHSKDCKNTPVCVQCAQAHTLPPNTCKAQPQYSNCTTSNSSQHTTHDCNHSANSRQCPTYKAALQSALHRELQQQ
ncbi:uncharacterized protein LOC118204360 [Stegodyphus dumicola]|uniref:uncharacterized protein LOC118204360 n=1 Tax=Stegodyphus dumicola TaxID=202533 RepID=UPI0015B2DA40|nr:uncharacterized protein LOC118204360 [Stegodyphus dumicola]